MQNKVISIPERTFKVILGREYLFCKLLEMFDTNKCKFTILNALKGYYSLDELNTYCTDILKEYELR